MMNLGDLEFKAIDFQRVYKAVGIPLGTDLTPLADHVNTLLGERLEKAPTILCDDDPGLSDEELARLQDEPPGEMEWIARLVCVEPRKREYLRGGVVPPAATDSASPAVLATTEQMRPREEVEAVSAAAAAAFDDAGDESPAPTYEGEGGAFGGGGASESWDSPADSPGDSGSSCDSGSSDSGGGGDCGGGDA